MVGARRNVLQSQTKPLRPGVHQEADPNQRFVHSYPVILSIENHCSVPQQKKMAQYLTEILGDKLDVSSVKVDESGRLPSPEALRGKILVKVKQEEGGSLQLE